MNKHINLKKVLSITFETKVSPDLNLKNFLLKYIFNVFTEVILLRDLSSRDRLLMKDGHMDRQSLQLPRQSGREVECIIFIIFSSI